MTAFVTESEGKNNREQSDANTHLDSGRAPPVPRVRRRDFEAGALDVCRRSSVCLPEELDTSGRLGRTEFQGHVRRRIKCENLSQVVPLARVGECDSISYFFSCHNSIRIYIILRVFRWTSSSYSISRAHLTHTNGRSLTGRA
jgi:hypothetical protein